MFNLIVLILGTATICFIMTRITSVASGLFIAKISAYVVAAVATFIFLLNLFGVDVYLLPLPVVTTFFFSALAMLFGLCGSLTWKVQERFRGNGLNPDEDTKCEEQECKEPNVLSQIIDEKKA